MSDTCECVVCGKEYESRLEWCPHCVVKHGYKKDREPRLRSVAGDRDDSLAAEAANQMKHLKDALKELVSIVEIHSEATGNDFAWAELDEARKALNA